MQIFRRLRCLANGQLNLWKCFYTVSSRNGIFFPFSFFFPSLSFHFCWLFLVSLLHFSFVLNSLPWLQKFHNCESSSSESPFALFSPHSVACMFTLWYATSSFTGLRCAAEVALHTERPWEGRRVPLQWVPLSNAFMCKAHRTYCREKRTWQIHFSLQQTQHAKSWQGWATEKPKCDMKARVFIIWARVWHHFMAFFFKKKQQNKTKKNPKHKTPTPKPLSPSAWELRAYFL